MSRRPPSPARPPAPEPTTVGPEPRALTPRQAEVLAVAGTVLESEGPAAVTMRRVAAELHIKAPSLYKHLAGKETLELWLVEQALSEMGAACHRVVTEAGPEGPITALLSTYRRLAAERPHRYRLVTGPTLPRSELLAGLEEWAGEPFHRATGEAHLAQALWAFAHGTAVLEIDRRFLPGSDLDRTWAAGAAAFTAVRTT